jgi:general secretion pathway protein F
MALFAYLAYTRGGKKIKGTVEAFSLQEAKDKVREQDFLLVDLKEHTDTTNITQLNQDALIVFTTQLTQLVTSKIPLYESLLALEEQARGEKSHALILAIGERIKTGSSLSKALGEFPKSFSPLYRALIQAGEAVGNLEIPLLRLTNLLTYQNRMKKQVMAALTYPFFLALLMLVAIGVLVGFVIPSLESLFEGHNVPWFTAFVFSVSQTLRKLWPVFLIGGASALFLGYFWLQKKETQRFLQRLSLKIPFLNKYVTHSALSRFAKTLSTLLDGGLPLTTSLEYAKEAVGNARIEEIIEKVLAKAIEGKTISSELMHFPEIPSLFHRMVKIGEESGKLSPLLSQVATMYEEETERTLGRLVSLAQPILLITMGIIIGAVVLAVLMPLSEFGSGLEI